LERFGLAAALAGDRDLAVDRWARAHGEYRRAGERRRAAHRAIWIAMSLLDRGEPARAAGWLARADRALEGEVEDCAERGWLCIPAGTRCIVGGDADGALAAFGTAAAAAERHGDHDLGTLAAGGR